MRSGNHVYTVYIYIYETMCITGKANSSFINWQLYILKSQEKKLSTTVNSSASG